MAIKVLHVIGGLKAAGAETAVINWLRNIDRNKYKFDFVVHLKDDFYSPEAKRLGCNIYHLPNPEKHGVRSWQREFEKLLSEKKYDIVHSHIFYFNGIALRSAKKMGVRVRISHAHNEQSRPDSNFLRKIYSLVAKHWIDKYATELIGCSNGALKNLYSNSAKDDKRLKVLHYGIDTSRFNSKKCSKQKSKRTLDLPTDAKIFLHIGRFAPVKNHKFLLEIFEEIYKRDKKTYFVLIGDGELKQNIEQSVQSSPISERVRFVGITKNITLWMAASDLIIFPSLFEGLPVTLIEAQATGLPCLISDRITKEIDLKKGLITFLSLSSKPSVWSERALGICRLKTPRNKTNSANSFDIDNITKKLIRIYERSGRQSKIR